MDERELEHAFEGFEHGHLRGARRGGGGDFNFIGAFGRGGGRGLFSVRLFRGGLVGCGLDSWEGVGGKGFMGGGTYHLDCSLADQIASVGYPQRADGLGRIGRER